MNNELIPLSVTELSTALQYLELTPFGRIEPFTALFRFVRAIEQMLIELCEKSGGVPEKRTTLGGLVRILSQRAIFPKNIEINLHTIVTTRNMAAHAQTQTPLNTLDFSEIKRRGIEIFRWYLIESNLGLKLSKEEASIILREVPKPFEENSKISKRIFLCYAKEDYEQVEKIYDKLLNRGHTPWMDKKDLLPGQEWEYEITRSIKSSDFFVACMSNRSVSKRGYVQKEVSFALDVLGEIPTGQIFLIPLRLEPCEVPPTLSFLHWLDIDSDENYQKLYEAIEKK